ncbi:hypothetical protein ACFW1A_15960 [Kitasatospora sp. NPDC058965]|uniref:hypothetical protein n=1 Tax=Kitasatospora sp. NPDC058965 TaxID=3346682 RepID=UPI0036759B91
MSKKSASDLRAALNQIFQAIADNTEAPANDGIVNIGDMENVQNSSGGGIVNTGSMRNVQNSVGDGSGSTQIQIVGSKRRRR